MSRLEGRERGLSDAVIVAMLAGLTAILLLQTVYQTMRLWDDAASLRARHAAQETVLADVEKVRSQLESLAGQTAILAETGNANARQLQEQLRAQGITIRPPASAPR
jgi:type II secretory pathway component PulM